ncbi:MAG: hypothetical protein LH630_07220 [Actinomycetia bacterium]|nr:hypothetical protein [Actinomycetes bacterium]
MGSRARLGAVIVQCHDPEALAAFWCGLLDCSPVVTDVAGSPYLGFERVAGLQPGSRVHVDLEPDDIEATTTWIEANGGIRTPAGDDSQHGERWRAMRDPEGNEFCLWFD